MILDVKSAFLYAKTKRRVYIELPARDKQAGGAKVGLLNKALYGTRDAPQLWAEEVQKVLSELGYVTSRLQPSVYYNQSLDSIIVVHVDDFMISAAPETLEYVKKRLSEKFEFTSTILGPGVKDAHETTYLNRTIRWLPTGVLEYEADIKHVGILFREHGMEHAEQVSTPMTKEIEQKLGNGEMLEASEASWLRRGIARVNYMAQDRPDLTYAARELSRFMAVPTEGTKAGLSHVIRYLRLHPRCVQSWRPEEFSDKPLVEVLTDSDWATDPVSRKSVSGGVVRFMGVTVSHWSKHQSSVALSSAEAEFNAVVKGLVEGIHVANLTEEILGKEVQIVVSTDASACKGMLLRSGVGKLKHMSTKQLWAQGAIASFGISVQKIGRSINSADCFTHVLSYQELIDHCHRMGFRFA